MFQETIALAWYGLASSQASRKKCKVLPMRKGLFGIQTLWPLNWVQMGISVRSVVDLLTALSYISSKCLSITLSAAAFVAKM